MDDIIVSKGGGFVMQDADHIRKFGNVLESSAHRTIVAVVSAPGSRVPGDKKVTDLLYQFCRDVDTGRRVTAKGAVVERFLRIMQDLNLPNVLQGQLVEEAGKWGELYEDALVSRGEYWSGRILAEYLGWEFVDAHDVFELTPQGWAIMKSGGERLLANVRAGKPTVVPGFYGRAGLFDGIKLFPRNASDLSGALIAEALNADRYEIWKDTAVRVASPKIVPEAQVVSYLTYREARELTYRGSEVVYSGAIHVARKADIPIRIANLDCPEEQGTLITSDDLLPPAKLGSISGIAGQTNIAVLTVSKPSMFESVGVAAEVFLAAATSGISVQHINDSTDSIDLVCDSTSVHHKFSAFETQIQGRLGADAEVYARHNLALICIVGRGLIGTSSATTQIFKTLENVGANPCSINRSMEELSIVLGVDQEHYLPAIQALCRELA